MTKLNPVFKNRQLKCIKALIILMVILITHPTSSAPFELSSYSNPTDIAPLTSSNNLSGITYNWMSDEYITVHQNVYCRLDKQLNELFCGSLSCGDCEDITFLGQNGAFYEYAIVEEGGTFGSVIIAQSPVSSHNLRLDQISTQVLTYAATIGGDSGEGVAYDAANQLFFVCIENPEMKVLSFQRPNHSDDASFSDGSLMVIEALTNLQLISILGASTDLSSCYFHPETGRILLMSDQAHNISDVSFSGVLFDQLALPPNRVEGFAFNRYFNELVVVSEPNNHQLYFASDVIFVNGF